MEKRYFVLMFQCLNMDCYKKSRLEDLNFDFIDRGHCENCKGTHFEIIKEKIEDSKIQNGQIAMIETKNLII